MPQQVYGQRENCEEYPPEDESLGVVLRMALRLLLRVSVMRARLSLAVISLFCSIIKIDYKSYAEGHGCAVHPIRIVNVNKFIL